MLGVLHARILYIGTINFARMYVRTNGNSYIMHRIILCGLKMVLL